MISFQIYFLRNGKRMVLKSINENDNFLIISAANKNNLAGPSIPSRGFPTGVSELYREDKRS